MNNKKQSFLVTITLFALVVASGCTGIGQERAAKVDPNNGIVINEFSVDPPRAVFGEDTVSVYLEVENVGGTTAKNVEVKLTGVGGFDGYTAKTIIPELSPPDISIEPPVPGILKAFVWELVPKNVGEGVSHIESIIGRVMYDYTTTAAVSIPVYSKAEYKRLQNLGQEIESTVTLSNTNAPVKIALSGEVPLVASEAGEEGSYIIEFINVGDGIPSTNNEDGQIAGKIKIMGPAEFVDCLGQSGTEITINPTGPIDEQIKIRRGESIKKACSIRLTTDWADAPKDSIQMTFDLDYRYYVQKEVAVNVIGARVTTP
jgi:hypothetical protein